MMGGAVTGGAGASGSGAGQDLGEPFRQLEQRLLRREPRRQERGAQERDVRDARDDQAAREAPVERLALRQHAVDGIVHFSAAFSAGST
jgi:nucleoside-diphosphate-sugar epimerase